VHTSPGGVPFLKFKISVDFPFFSETSAGFTEGAWLSSKVDSPCRSFSRRLLFFFVAGDRCGLFPGE